MKLLLPLDHLVPAGHCGGGGERPAVAGIRGGGGGIGAAEDAEERARGDGLRNFSSRRTAAAVAAACGIDGEVHTG